MGNATYNRVMARVSTAVLVSMLAAYASLLAARQFSIPSACDPDNGGLTLIAGFCASVVADNLGPARHIAVAPNGDLYVELHDDSAPGGSVIALRDTDGDGRFDERQHFATGVGGSAVAWRNNQLYVGADTKIVRFQMDGVALLPIGPPEVVVDDLPDAGGHSAKSFAFGEHGEIYVHVGAPTNNCQTSDRVAGAPGRRPCPDLTLGAGIWQYEADSVGQAHSASNRFATGIRHTVGVAWNTTTHSLWTVQNGRDQLDLWPAFDAVKNAELPAEELQEIKQGADYGWPYCYFDPFLNTRVEAPEYGGDGRAVADCAKYAKPVATFPAHYAPLDLLFYTGTQFPAQYRNGVFVAFHGSWNRSPLPQAGYNVMFQPLKGDISSGEALVFADGFAGTSRPSPGSAQHRPVGLAEAPDGSLYVSDDSGGRIWRISYSR
jgi:glucose/arabinose dehydrogenase